MPRFLVQLQLDGRPLLEGEQEARTPLGAITAAFPRGQRREGPQEALQMGGGLAWVAALIHRLPGGA